MEIPLFESRSAQADVNGKATVFFSPGVAGSSWMIERIVTSVAPADPYDLINLVLYKNVVSEANRLDATTNAAQNSSETKIPLQASDTILGVYTAAPVGSYCTLTISGTKETGRR